MSFVVRGAPWQQPKASDVETRVRVERVLARARVLFAIVTLAAIYVDPGDLASNASITYELLAVYVSFGAIIMIVARVAPSYLLRAGLALHLVDVLFAAVITFLTRGSGSPFFVFFVFVLFAAPVRWGMTAALLTGVVAVVLFLAESQLVPLASRSEPAEMTRTIMRTSYFMVLTLTLAFAAGQARAFRTESDALSRVLTGVCSAASFSDGLRLFLDECLLHVGSSRALVALEHQAAQRLYLWTANRPNDIPRTNLTLEDLAPDDRDIYFARPPRHMLVWHVRRHKDGRLVARGVGAETLEALIPIDGSFMRAVLDRHHASSALTADVNPGPDWRVRLLLLDPESAGLDDFYFLRMLVRHAAPALHHEYMIRRVRSRVGATERARLARDLHDGLLQSLIGLEMEIEVLRRGASQTPVSESRLCQLRDQLRHDIADVRDLMLRLRLVEMAGDDVLRIIAELAGRLRRETGIDVRVASTGSFLDCAPRNCAHLARIAQEALTNVRKHSHARSVTITIADTAHGGRLTVADDGRGFGFKGRFTLEQLEASDLGPGVIKERVRAMGGQLTIQSYPDEGAQIEVEWTKVPHG